MKSANWLFLSVMLPLIGGCNEHGQYVGDGVFTDRGVTSAIKGVRVDLFRHTR